ncbi:MAG TPA: C39 family peptidase [Patescibacteria group bacterium]|jgi:uncharacterized protein YvpB|nr:C39 family peptidase [Patescibacteria group bacterium]
MQLLWADTIEKNKFSGIDFSIFLWHTQPMKLKRKRLWQGVAAAIGAAVILSLFWNQGLINLPPKLVYAFRLMHYRMLSGKIHGKTTVKLNVLFHKQEHSLSCEVATLKMALAAFKIDVPESELISNLAFDQTRKTGSTWGDPNLGFVGSIDGQMPQTGYGVYAHPIALLAARWTKAEAVTNITNEEIASHLLAGRPVIVWGYLGRGQKITWNNSDNQPINAVNGEHTRVVIGFTGDVKAPEGFYLIDPWFGPITLSAEQLKKNMEPLGKMAVVVYNDKPAD